ncbi:non-oxidative hydroxyarylic acid decarboxylases subunit D [Chloroflexota bacterium]
MKNLSCARCESANIEKISDSPVKGKWEAFRCADCNFVWRSYEDLSGIPKNMDYLRKSATVFFP